MIKYPKLYCKNKNIVLTMGTFDGVHLGHQKLLRATCKQAKKIGGKSIALTYYNHPRQLFVPNIGKYLLTEKAQKEKLIKSYGIDYVLFLNFTKEVANLSAENFIKKALMQNINATQIIAGYDTHFGKNKAGNFRLLFELQNKYNYKAFLVKPLKIDGTIISSSIIRESIKNGDIDLAKKYLGRNFCVYGKVVHGKQLGRTFGYPTINVVTADEHKLVPKVGVYYTKVFVKNKSHLAVANIGYSPTVKTDIKVPEIEAFLLDFKGDLYCENVKIEFIKRLRDETKFASKELLIKAIQNDVETARKLHANS